MTNDQLIGKYARLRREWVEAQAAAPAGGTRHVGRLAVELTELERALAIRAPADEQTDDAVLGYLGEAGAMPLRLPVGERSGERRQAQ